MSGLGEFSFCESVTAGSSGNWHIRKLGEAGHKYTGGIDTPSLCNHVRPPYGWDLRVPVDRKYQGSTCPQCWAELGALLETTKTGVDHGTGPDKTVIVTRGANRQEGPEFHMEYQGTFPEED